MPPKFEIPQGDSLERKIEIYQEKQRLSFIAGYIMMSVQYALRHEDPTKLIEILKQFGSEDPQELIDLSFSGLKPFKGLKPHNIVRFPDEVREQSLLDNSTETLDGECPCEVSFHAGETYVRWTLPRAEIITENVSNLKLVHLGLVIIEELMHIRQIIGPNTRAINSLSTFYEFNQIPSTSKMAKEDQDLLASILETDITYFQDKYFGDMFDLQWFRDRHSATDYHKTLTAAEFIDAILYLSDKYGDIDEVSEIIIDDIFNAIDFNPYIGLPLLLSRKLYEYADHKKILMTLMKFLSDCPEAVENEKLAPIVAEVLKMLVKYDKGGEA